MTLFWACCFFPGAQPACSALRPGLPFGDECSDMLLHEVDKTWGILSITQNAYSVAQLPCNVCVLPCLSVPKG